MSKTPVAQKNQKNLTHDLWRSCEYEVFFVGDKSRGYDAKYLSPFRAIVPPLHAEENGKTDNYSSIIHIMMMRKWSCAVPIEGKVQKSKPDFTYQHGFGLTPQDAFKASSADAMMTLGWELDVKKWNKMAYRTMCWAIYLRIQQDPRYGSIIKECYRDGYIPVFYERKPYPKWGAYIDEVGHLVGDNMFGNAMLEQIDRFMF